MAVGYQVGWNSFAITASGTYFYGKKFNFQSCIVLCHLTKCTWGFSCPNGHWGDRTSGREPPSNKSFERAGVAQSHVPLRGHSFACLHLDRWKFSILQIYTLNGTSITNDSSGRETGIGMRERDGQWCVSICPGTSHAIELYLLSQKTPDITARTVQSILHDTRPNAVISGYKTRDETRPNNSKRL